MSKVSKSQREESADTLRTLLAPNGKERKRVLSILRHCSRSGMMRDISFVMIDTQSDDIGGKPFVRDITWHISNVLGYPQSKGPGIKVGGCGMDMGFHVVYALGSRLWPDGVPEPHGTRNGEPDREGGYAIDHSWL